MTLVNELANAATQFNFEYYLIATSTLPLTEMGDDEGWSKEYTSLKLFANWAEKTANVARVFSSYSQGLAIVEAVEKVAGEVAKSGPPDKPKKINKSDLVKNEAISKLREMMSE